METCPSPEQLESFATGRLSQFDRSAVDTHIQTCPTCRDTVANMTREQSDTVAVPKPATPKSAPVPPELVDHPRYRVLGVLSVGGMGAIYRAEHRLLERPVVLKSIRPEFLGDRVQVQRFLREAKLAANLMHPNVVTIYEAERIGSAYFLVMEHLEGSDLSRVARHRGPLPVGEACEWVRQAALGLQHVHERGLVHRDIKPSNLFLTADGRVKLLDLGLATVQGTVASSDRLTERGQVLGTVDYMAPEQWEASGDVDIRADIYGLGCTLYDLLAGRPPFGGAETSSLIQKMRAHSDSPVTPIRNYRPDVPAALWDVLTRMLAKRPEDRFAAPGEAAEALARFAAAGPSPAATVPPDAPHAGGPNATTAARPVEHFRGRAIVRVGNPNANANTPPARRRALAVGGVLGLAALAALAAFVGRPDTGVGPRRAAKAAPSGPPIRVGVLHSRTGTMAASERPVIDATLLAVAEVNAAGGVLGRPVEAVVADGASDPAAFAQLAERLIVEDGVAAVFGCWTSAGRRTARPVFERRDHLLFYPVQYEGLERSPNVVYTGAAPNQQIIPAVEWFCRTLGKKRLFLVGSDYVFPHAAHAIIRDQAAELGVTVAGEAYIPLGGTDAGPAVRKIVEAKPDLILNTINGDSNVAFFRALRAAGVTPAAVPTVSFSISEGELSSLRARDVAGDYAAWNYFQSIDTAANRAFVARFRAKYGEDRVVSDPMEAAYTGVHLWADAARAAGSAEPAAVRHAVRGRSFDAPQGPVRIDPETQHAVKAIRIGRISPAGGFEVVHASEFPVNPVPYPNTRSRAAWDKFLNDLYKGWGDRWENPGP